MMWIAYYQPYRPKGSEDPTKRGFTSKEEAEKYVISKLCGACKKERNPRQSGCFCEWLILKEKDFDKAKNHDELMEAAGWKVVYPKKQ